MKSNNVNVLKKDTKIDDVWTSCYCACKKKKKKERREWEKEKPAPKYTRVWLVAVMIVCKRTAHSWSVLCPSFFPLLHCPRVASTTYTLPPTSSALLFAFFFLLACVRAFVFSFHFLFSRICASTFAVRPYGRTRRREKSVVFRVRKRQKKKKRREDGMLA
jgi:hypothetical protein